MVVVNGYKSILGGPNLLSLSSSQNGYLDVEFGVSIQLLSSIFVGQREVTCTIQAFLYVILIFYTVSLQWTWTAWYFPPCFVDSSSVRKAQASALPCHSFQHTYLYFSHDHRQFYLKFCIQAKNIEYIDRLFKNETRSAKWKPTVYLEH